LPQSHGHILAFGDERDTMATSFTEQDQREHFAHCVQVLGGVTASSRRLGIDERALRRFISGERPLSPGLLADTAKALRTLAIEATVAADHIAAVVGAPPSDPAQ